MARPKKRKYTRRIPTATALVPGPVTEKTLGEEIIEQMKHANAALAALVAVMQGRQSRGLVTTSIEEAAAHVGVQTTTAEVAAPKRRGRPPKIRTEPAETVLEKADEQQFDRNNFPKACACGVREDLPPHLHSKHCPVHGDGKLAEHQKAAAAGASAAVVEAPKASEPPVQPAPSVTPIPTMEDVRAAAIGFAGRHGKEKLTELWSKFGVDRLSAIPTEKYTAVLASLAE